MDRLLLGACGVSLWLLGQYLKKKNIAKASNFIELIEAKVVSVRTSGVIDRGKARYYPTLEYSYQGKIYQTSDNEGVSNDMHEGDVFSIYIDPKNPQNACLVKGGETIFSFAAKIFGTFMIISMVLLYIL